MKQTSALSAREAAALLGVKRGTLYAYVSRGWLRRLQGEGRASRYLRQDVERLRARHDARSGHAAVASAALRFGEPVLDSALTAIDERGPRYRGQLAVELVRAGVSFEQAAELLWTGALPERAPHWQVAGVPRALSRALATSSDPIALALCAVPLTALDAPARFAATRERELELGRSLIGMLARLAPAAAGPAASVAEALLGSRPKGARALSAVTAALVLVLDHELNPSTFAARVAASTGADLPSCLCAGMAALHGPLHGAASERVEALLDELGSAREAAARLEARARRGEALPGFNHPLYPNGDPRARLLLDTAYELGAKSARLGTLRAAERYMRRERGEHPNVDFGLVAVALAASLARGSAARLFLVGRSAGFVAHVLEQRESGVVLRPRARYVGP